MKVTRKIECSNINKKKINQIVYTDQIQYNNLIFLGIYFIIKHQRSYFQSNDCQIKKNKILLLFLFLLLKDSMFFNKF